MMVVMVTLMSMRLNNPMTMAVTAALAGSRCKLIAAATSTTAVAAASGAA
jgi:hypothetical protein